MHPLFIGTGFSAQAGTLVPIEREALVARIRSGDEGLRAQVEMLRRAAQLDPALYRQRKAHLPYFIGVEFVAGQRRADQLIAAHVLVLDLDHCHSSAEQFARLRKSLCEDSRVWLCYTSPSGQGLKLAFRLDRPIRESKTFSDVYQAFARQFSRQHSLDAWIDLRTHDVARVSFLSFDPEVYVAPDAETLPVAALAGAAGIPGLLPEVNELPPSDLEIIDVELPELPRLRPSPKVPDLPAKSDLPPLPPEDTPPESPPVPPPAREPEDAVWTEIRRTLSPGRPLRSRQVNVPEAIEAITPQVRAAAEALGITLRETLDLNYGRKFVFAYQQVWAEIDLHHGRRGFSLVKSLKSGAHPELRDLVYDLMHQLIFDPEGLDELAARMRDRDVNDHDQNPPWE